MAPLKARASSVILALTVVFPEILVQMTSQQNQPPDHSISPSDLDPPPETVNIAATPGAFPPVTPPHRPRQTRVPPPLPDRAGRISTAPQLSPTEVHLLKQGTMPNLNDPSLVPPTPSQASESSNDGDDEAGLRSDTSGPGSDTDAPGDDWSGPENDGGGPGNDGSGPGSDSGSSSSSSSSARPHLRDPVLVDHEVHTLLARPLHPCQVADESQIHNLLDAVWVELPPVSALYSAGSLTATRKPTTFDNMRLPPRERLEKIVPIDEMDMDELKAEVATLLRQIPIDLSNNNHRAFLNRIWTWNNALNCPKLINSEVDTEDWTNEVIFRPAMAIVYAIYHRSIPAGDSEPRFPFFSSAHSCNENRPDRILTVRGEYPNEEVGLCKEDKTHAVLAFNKNPLAPVQKRPNTQVPGAAHKFNWPILPDDLCSSDDVGSSIIVQIWSQLIEWKACWGALSSMEITTFYSRDEEHENTLFITGPYDREDPVLFMAVCWMLIASDFQYLSSLNTPAADTTWWTRDIKKFKRPGFKKY